jgi:hypothetical protein
MATTLRLTMFGYQFALGLAIRKTRKERQYGYTNRCKNGKYIVMIDIDGIPLTWLGDEIIRLQNDFMLSDFYVFESSQDNYHAVCFDKVTLGEYLNILRNSTTDQNYIQVPLNYGKKIWTLRLSEKDTKIKYIAKIPSIYHHRTKSTAHMNILAKSFDMNITRHNEDCEDRIVLSTYLTP